MKNVSLNLAQVSQFEMLLDSLIDSISLKNVATASITTMRFQLAEMKKILGESVVKPLLEPLSENEMRKQSKADEQGYIKGIVAVDLDEITGTSFESFLDIISAKLTGSECLSDSSYEVVGNNGNTLFIEVSGDPSLVIEMEDDEDDEPSNISLTEDDEVLTEEIAAAVEASHDRTNTSI